MYLVKIKNDTNETTLPQEYRVNARVTKTKNKSDSFDFEVTNEFDKSLLKPFTTLITVIDNVSVLFRGRLTSQENDMYNFGIVSCEGALSFLNDTYYPPFEWKSTPEALLSSLLDNHNANVEDDKKIYLGTVTVTDPNNYLGVSSEDYMRTLNVLNEKLIDKLGGYLVVRYEDDGTYIDWLTDILCENSQRIELGDNLIDVNVEKAYGEVVTRLIPLGAKDEETGKRVDITSVNNGKNYIDNEKGIEAYGVISGVVNWDDVTEPSNLFKKAKQVSDTLASGKCTITVKAIDLNMVDSTIEKFKLGDWIKTVIPTHNINEFYQLNQIEYYLDMPENNTITLGDIKDTNTSNNRKDSNNIKEILDTVVNKGKNTLMATKIAGVLNLMNTSLRAQKNVAQKQDVRAILFEDLDKDSDTFGAMCIGTQGIQIAKQRNELDTDWVWGTAIDFQAIYAQYIITGILSDKLGNNYWDLDKGELVTKKGLIGGFDITENGLVKSVKTVLKKNYTDADAQRVKDIIMGDVVPTEDDYKYYDLTGDGEIQATDWARINSILKHANGVLYTEVYINSKTFDSSAIYEPFVTIRYKASDNKTVIKETVLSAGAVKTGRFEAESLTVNGLDVVEEIESLKQQIEELK